MIHTTSRSEEGKAGVPASNNGCIVKTVRYIGRAAHAGGAPHMGVNALYAAQIGLMSINAVRETFRDEDTIRVHPIITHGGSQVMPILHTSIGGAIGTGHGADFAIVDKPLAYLGPAKALAAMVVDMMWDRAAGAREVLAKAKPPMTRASYLAAQRGLARRETY